MSAQGSSATNVVQLDAAGRRQAKIVAAARVVSIDYRSIVDNAVEGLTNNTPDARREVYAQARGIVKRHLQLMRLPEPIVESKSSRSTSRSGRSNVSGAPGRPPKRRYRTHRTCRRRPRSSASPRGRRWVCSPRGSRRLGRRWRPCSSCSDCGPSSPLCGFLTHAAAIPGVSGRPGSGAADHRHGGLLHLLRRQQYRL